MALLAVAVPGAEAHDLGGLVVVGDAPLLQDLVAGRGDEAVARVGGFGVAGAEVVLGGVEVAGHAQMVAGGPAGPGTMEEGQTGEGCVRGDSHGSHAVGCGLERGVR